MYGYIWVYVDSVAFVDAEELFKVCGGADTLFLTHYSARRTGLGWAGGWPGLYLKSSCNFTYQQPAAVPPRERVVIWITVKIL